MGVSVVKFSRDAIAREEWGVVIGDQIHPVALPAADHRDIMRIYFGDQSAFHPTDSADIVHRDDVSFHAPVSRDIQLFCQGLNYADHRDESGQKHGGELEENLMFMKAASSICGANETIVRPKGCQLLDYEIELGLVLKSDLPARSTVNEKDLSKYIGALVLTNDVSARDLMFGAPMLQWFKGKSQRTFCPTGPVLYLMDQEDFAQLYNLQLTLKLNGRIKQQSTTDKLIHKPAKTLTELASFTDVNCGDMVLTGTPGGVLAGANLKSAMAILLNMKNDTRRRAKFTQAQLAVTPFLEPGDVLELEIKSLDGLIDLGRQQNYIRDF